MNTFYKRLNSVVFIVFCLTAHSSYGQGQAEMNQDASKRYNNSDKELNRVYQDIVKQYAKDKTFITNLKASQRLWIQFRDAEVRMKYPEGNFYGSVQPMCRASYLEQLTKERVKTLRVWLDGIEEGDVCAGSVKIK